MKLTVIGGGGVRSMFLAKSIAQKAATNGSVILKGGTFPKNTAL